MVVVTGMAMKMVVIGKEGDGVDDGDVALMVRLRVMFTMRVIMDSGMNRVRENSKQANLAFPSTKLLFIDTHTNK